MLNRYAWWQYAMIAVVIAVGVLYALPNLFGNDPAVQISSTKTAVKVDQALHDRIQKTLQDAGLTPDSLELDAVNGRLLVRFENLDQQRQAADLLRGDLGHDYVTALNLAPATPGVLQSMGLDPMYLGLDLRGGVHFLMEVDMASVLKMAQDALYGNIRTLLRENKLRYTALDRDDQGVNARFGSSEDRARAMALLSEDLRDSKIEEVGDNGLKITLTPEKIEEQRNLALQQNLSTLRNRVNELGVAEPIIQRQGKDRIIVQLPGVQDTARAKEILNATATLEFRLVDTDNDPYQAQSTGRIPVGSRLYRERNGRPVLLKRQLMLKGDRIVDAASGLDQQSGSPAVFVTLDGSGARQFANATKPNIGKPMGVVFIENKIRTEMVDGEPRKIKTQTEEVINIATIRDTLSKRFQITGLDSTQEARDLALLLRAGALSAPIEIIEERTVGPSAGKENIEQGYQSALVALALVLLFMGFYYRMFGLVSDVALMVNVVLIVALLSMLQATLTLPGIAGIILTMGMAVDANVLIFERIREELKAGNSPQAAIHTGYDRAFSTILDANVTTLIAAIVLFGFGTGPIKGFAVTLSIGIATSMFTAIVGSRAAVNYLYGGKRLKTLPI